MVSSEAAPWAKTGGLADVVGALPASLQPLGNEVAVLIPRYSSIDLKGSRRVYNDLPIFLAGKRYDTSIYLAKADFPLYLLDCPALYDRPGLYNEAGVDYPDNHIRFAVLARAGLAVARLLFRTEIFHCHDWQTGTLPVYLKTTFANDPTFIGVKTLFTIHNLGYQGLFRPSALSEVALDSSVYRPDRMEFYSNISYIKGGIQYADALTTVSPTYAREIQTPEYGFGLDGALRSRANVLTGIVNGIDYKQWNPKTDPYLPAHFSATDLAGKKICKQHLLTEYGLPPEAIDRPLIGIVSRFASQKGTELVAQVIPGILAENMYLVVLGNGDPGYEDYFQRLASENPGRIGVRIGFDNGLAHRIEAGSDMFLMPSRYEPCGLNQLYSLRYGTVPIVRATGGLDDTIEESTGFKFAEYTGHAFWQAIRAAVDTYANRDSWQQMVARGMQKDFSWDFSAAAYSALYRQLLGRI